MVKKKNEPPRERNSQPPEAHFKPITSHPNTTHVVSAIVGRLNHRDIDNVNVEVHPSDYPVESNYESVTDPYTTPIKSIYDNVMDHLL